MHTERNSSTNYLCHSSTKPPQAMEHRPCGAQASEHGIYSIPSTNSPGERHIILPSRSSIISPLLLALHNLQPFPRL